jgi:hypothetical protein
MFVLPLNVDMLVSPSDVAVSDLWTYLTKPDLFIFPEFNQVTNLNKKKRHRLREKDMEALRTSNLLL